MKPDEAENRIKSLELQVRGLQRALSRNVGPYSKIFLAERTGKQFKEQTVADGEVLEFVDGRQVQTDDAPGAIIDLPSDVVALMAIDDIDAESGKRVTRYVPLQGPPVVVSFAPDEDQEPGIYTGTAYNTSGLLYADGEAWPSTIAPDALVPGTVTVINVWEFNGSPGPVHLVSGYGVGFRVNLPTDDPEVTMPVVLISGGMGRTDDEDTRTVMGPIADVDAHPDEGTEAAYADTWLRGDGSLVVSWITRIGYFDAGLQKLFAYHRQVYIDTMGAVVAMSAEERIEIDAPEACP